MNPIPQDARRRIVQAAAEISVGIDNTPAGRCLKASIEAMLEALDAYNAACGSSLADDA